MVSVESLDLKPNTAHDAEGKVVFIAGALPGRRVRVTVQRRKNNWGAGHRRGRGSARARSACDHSARTSATAAAADAAPDVAAQVATKQRALEDALWHLGKVKAKQLLRPIEGPAWGYRYRAAVGAVCRQEGQGAGRLPRAQSPASWPTWSAARCCRRISRPCCCRCAN